MARTVPEWRGATDDTPPPPRVRLRVLERFGGRCYLSGREIRPGDPWQCDHIIALSNGGENRESNLAPALAEAHAEKTAVDRQIKAKADSIRKRHLGIAGKSRAPGRGFLTNKSGPFKKKMNGTVERRRQ